MHAEVSVVSELLSAIEHAEHGRMFAAGMDLGLAFADANASTARNRNEMLDAVLDVRFFLGLLEAYGAR